MGFGVPAGGLARGGLCLLAGILPVIWQ